METQSDFKELLALLNANHVEYIIVGGYALAFYGLPRFTGDLDLLVKPDVDNAQSILDALSEFGFSSLGLTEDDFIQPEQVVQLGRPPVRVDFITSISGVTWDEAWEDRIEGSYGDIPVYYLSRDQFIANKLATGRTRDLADVELLNEMIESEET
ncbi:MAG: hypothetical protein EBZ36_09980 [Acidobacteria bacterium]|nr:hypothetical protein [Acidobacteriota bacterium]